MDQDRPAAATKDDVLHPASLRQLDEGRGLEHGLGVLTQKSRVRDLALTPSCAPEPLEKGPDRVRCVRLKHPIQITDVTSHPLGIVVLDKQLNERVVKLIPSATPLPCEKRGRFAYAYDNMTAVRVEITEGEGQNRDEVKVIGEVILEDLPPRPRGTPIDVIYRYNVNQILEVDVMDVQTKAVRRARMDLKGGLGAAGIAEARRKVANAQLG